MLSRHSYLRSGSRTLQPYELLLSSNLWSFFLSNIYVNLLDLYVVLSDNMIKNKWQLVTLTPTKMLLSGDVHEYFVWMNILCYLTSWKNKNKRSMCYRF